MAESRTLRRRVLLGIATLIAAAAFAIDSAITREQVAPVPPPCGEVTDALCNDERNAAFEVRLDEVFELEDGLEARYWLYAALFVGAGLTIAVAGPRGERESLGTALDDLGILGVAWLAGSVVYLVAVDSGFPDTPATPLIAPAVAFVVAGGFGRVALRDGGERARPPDRGGALVSWVGVGFAAAAAVLAAIVLITQSAQQECGVDDAAVVDSLRTLSAAAGVGAAALGLASLFARRWIQALVCITVGPVAALLAVVAGACFG